MNAFEKLAAEAENRGAREVARRIRIEGKMATALIDALLERGYRVTVNDGEEDAVVMSTNKEELLEAMFSTDEDFVILYPKDNKECAGWFFLVYGNDGWDVISDYSSNPVCDEIWNNVLSPLSDALESGRNL